MALIRDRATNAAPPLIREKILSEEVAARTLHSGIVFDGLRQGAGQRPGVLTKVGMDTFVDPIHDGTAMNSGARATPVVRRIDFEAETRLYVQAIRPDAATIRTTTADDAGNLTFEHEGTTFGAVNMALAARDCGGIVIAQAKRAAARGAARPHAVGAALMGEAFSAGRGAALGIVDPVVPTEQGMTVALAAAARVSARGAAGDRDHENAGQCRRRRGNWPCAKRLGRHDRGGIGPVGRRSGRVP